MTSTPAVSVDPHPPLPVDESHDPDHAVSDAAIAPEDEAISHPLTGDAPVAPQAPTFADLQVDPRIVQALLEVGIERTFAIQSLTLPIALVGSDLIGQARTGMGKTLGFGVPLLQRLALDERAPLADTENGDPAGYPQSASGGKRRTGHARLAAGRAPRALIMVPTRELCVQVTRDLHQVARYLGLAVTAVYGGRAYEPQITALHAGVDLVVGTPGRLLDLANGGHLQLGAIKVLVLDEADEMLDLGFLPDMERVLGMVPDAKQTMLFSATMPGPIITLARTFMSQPTHIRAEMPSEGVTHLNTTQYVYRAHAMDKIEMLSRALQAEGRGLTMVFTRTKRTAQKVADELIDRGFAAAAVHGDLGQGAREQALRAFRSGKVDVLVATDVAARGIDVEDVTHVFNYQCPEEDKTYIHRIGRTGRAGKDGLAVTFVDWDDIPRWQLINESLGLDFADPPETYSTSKHLYDDLGIPEGVTGRLPRGQQVRAGLDAEAVEDLGETGGRRRKATTGSAGGRSSSSGRSSSAERNSSSGRSSSAGRNSSSGRSSSAGRGEPRRAQSARPAQPVADPTREGSPAGDAAATTDDAGRRRRSRPRRRTRAGTPAGVGAPDVP